jgi:hypothetical protein
MSSMKDRRIMKVYCVCTESDGALRLIAEDRMYFRFPSADHKYDCIEKLKRFRDIVINSLPGLNLRIYI